MARVWFVFDGPKHAGEPIAELTIRECEERLKLERCHCMSLPERETPRFRGLRDRLREPKHVVVEILDCEDLSWPVGFYGTPISPDEARKALLD